MMNDNDVVPFPALVESDLESAITPNVRKILDAAEEHGWSENPYVSVVIRLAKPGDDLAKPFFMKWTLSRKPDGGRSWRFEGARANNGQPLGFRDCLVYLQDPAVIYPEDPSEGENQDAHRPS